MDLPQQPSRDVFQRFRDQFSGHDDYPVEQEQTYPNPNRICPDEYLELVQRFCVGEDAQAMRIAANWHRQLWSFTGAREDAVHEIAARLLDKYDRYQQTAEPFEHWASVVAVNLMRDLADRERRRRKRDAEVKSGSIDWAMPKTEQADSCRHREDRLSAFERLVSPLLHHLSERQRQVIEASYRCDDDQRIADHLGISPKTVRNHRDRAIQRLQPHLRERDFYWSDEEDSPTPNSQRTS